MFGSHRSLRWPYFTTTIYHLFPFSEHISRHKLGCSVLHLQCFNYCFGGGIDIDLNCNKCGKTSRSDVGVEAQKCRNIKASTSDHNLCLDTKLCIGYKLGEDKIHSITFDVFMVLIILCILVSIISYTKIYLRLRHHQIRLHENQPQGQLPNGGEIPLNIARYKKTVSSIARVQLALLICYLPHIVLNILSFHDVLHVHLGRAIDVTFSFLFLNSSLNPILYCWKIKDVRQAVKDTIKFNCCPSS